MSDIRSHAVRLIDAYGVPDYLLESALVRYNADVYNDLSRRACKEDPLNVETFNHDWKSEEIVIGGGKEKARSMKLWRSARWDVSSLAWSSRSYKLVEALYIYTIHARLETPSDEESSAVA